MGTSEDLEKLSELAASMFNRLLEAADEMNSDNAEAQAHAVVAFMTAFVQGFRTLRYYTHGKTTKRVMLDQVATLWDACDAAERAEAS
jgi:hypothetical protein